MTSTETMLVGRPSFFTVPNLLSLSRVPLAALIWVEPTSSVLILVLSALAALTDLLDGWSARHIRARRLARGEPVEEVAGPRSVGAWLDPLCDKVFVLSVLGAVWFAHDVAPVWLVAVGARELLLAPAFFIAQAMASEERKRRFDYRAGPLGKLCTVAQFTALAAFILGSPAVGRTSAILAAVLGVAAVVAYVIRGLRIEVPGPRERPAHDPRPS